MRSNKDTPLLTIAGPTASGKSDLAISIAKQLKGEILGCDSVQVYRGVSIGSVKPTPQEMNSVEHHLIDICTPADRFNSRIYVELAQRAINDIRSRGKLAVSVGCRTLYISNLIYGLSKAPAKGDKPRIHQPSLIVAIVWSRSELFSKIDSRPALMLKAGLLAETKEIMKIYGPKNKVLSNLGYRECLQYVNGEIERAELESEIAKNTRCHAELQMKYLITEPRKRGWRSYPSPAKKLPELLSKTRITTIDNEPVFSLSQPELTRLIKRRLSQPFKGVEVWFVSNRCLDPF